MDPFVSMATHKSQLQLLLVGIGEQKNPYFRPQLEIGLQGGGGSLFIFFLQKRKGKG